MRRYASPIFQHRHYAVIAKALADCPINGEAKAAIISDLCQTFRDDNVKFDRQRFIDATRGEPSNGKDKR
jgi:hypothetical protein